MNEYQTQLSHLMLFAQSIGIGFLIGLERERHNRAIAGVRTFTLIALAGSLAGRPAGCPASRPAVRLN